MRPWHQIAAGIVIALAYFFALDFVPQGGLAFMLTGFALLIVALIQGTKLSLMLRVIITVNVFCWAYTTCLVGRTMEPGLTGYTIGMALTTFCFYGLWPGFALLRLWSPRVAVVLMCVLFPVCLSLAATVAGTEEYLFVRKYHDTGVGPTARRTVSMHWLSYDRETQRLNGSD